jgi:hypothetical protein
VGRGLFPSHISKTILNNEHTGKPSRLYRLIKRPEEPYATFATLKLTTSSKRADQWRGAQRYVRKKLVHTRDESQAHYSGDSIPLR